MSKPARPDRHATKRQLVRIIEIAQLDDDRRVVAALEELGRAVSAATDEQVASFDGAHRYLSERLGVEAGEQAIEREPSIREKIIAALEGIYPEPLTAWELAEQGCGVLKSVKRELNRLARTGRVQEAGTDVVGGRSRTKLWRASSR